MTSWQGAEHQAGQGRTELAAGMSGHGLSLCHVAANQSRGAFFGGSTRAFPCKLAARSFAQRSNSRWHQEAADTLPAAALCLYGWLRQGDSGGGTELSWWEPHGSSSPITCTGEAGGGGRVGSSAGKEEKEWVQEAFSAKGRNTPYRHSRHKDSRNGSAVTSPPASRAAYTPLGCRARLG